MAEITENPDRDDEREPMLERLQRLFGCDGVVEQPARPGRPAAVDTTAPVYREMALRLILYPGPRLHPGLDHRV